MVCRQKFDKQNKEHQLIFINTMLTFEDSKERCKDVGGELAAPLTETEIRDWLIVIHINYVVYNKLNFSDCERSK